MVNKLLYSSVGDAIDRIGTALTHYARQKQAKSSNSLGGGLEYGNKRQPTLTSGMSSRLSLQVSIDDKNVHGQLNAKLTIITPSIPN